MVLDIWKDLECLLTGNLCHHCLRDPPVPQERFDLFLHHTAVPPAKNVQHKQELFFFFFFKRWQQLQRCIHLWGYKSIRDMSSAAGTRCLCCLRWSPVLTLMSIAVLVSSMLFSINTAVGLVHPFFFVVVVVSTTVTDVFVSRSDNEMCFRIAHRFKGDTSNRGSVIIWQRYCCGVLLFLWLSHNQGSTLRGHEGDGAMIWKILLQTNLYLYQMYVAGVFPLSQSTVGGGRGAKRKHAETCKIGEWWVNMYSHTVYPPCFLAPSPVPSPLHIHAHRHRQAYGSARHPGTGCEHLPNLSLEKKKKKEKVICSKALVLPSLLFTALQLLTANNRRGMNHSPELNISEMKMRHNSWHWASISTTPASCGAAKIRPQKTVLVSTSANQCSTSRCTRESGKRRRRKGEPYKTSCHSPCSRVK